MRDNFLVIYKHKGKQYMEFCPACRIETIKAFANEILRIEFIG